LRPDIERLKKLIKAFADPLEGVETIYHYTTAEGFKGIIESSEIWLTNTEFVNDLTECKALQKEPCLFKKSDFAKNKYVQNAWEYILQTGNRDKNSYIASFSKDGDSLEQWRAYGNFCIGFEVGKLKKTGFYLFECVYDIAEIRRWILEKGKLPEWELDQPDKIEKRNDGYIDITRYCEERDAAAHTLLFNASKKLKDKHYKNEKEVRLIAISNHKWGYPNSPGLYKKDPPIHFRVHPVLKPYVKFFISDEGEQKVEEEGNKTEREVKEKRLKKEMNQKRAILPINEVIVGPMVHQQEAMVACKILLCEKGYEKTQVAASKIPYRGF